MNPALSHFFDSLLTVADLEYLVQARRVEDLYLEFKAKHAGRHQTFTITIEKTSPRLCLVSLTPTGEF